MIAVGPLQLKTFYSIPFHSFCPLPFHPPLPLWAAAATKGKGAPPVLGRGAGGCDGGTAALQRLLLLPLTLRPGAGGTPRSGGSGVPRASSSPAAATERSGAAQKLPEQMPAGLCAW